MDGVIAGQADPTRMTGALGTAGRQDRQRETYRRSREQFRSRRSRPDVDPLTGEIDAHQWSIQGLPHGVNECSADARPSLLDRAEAVIREVFGDENVEVVA
jgi:hypothetical protein